MSIFEKLNRLPGDLDTFLAHGGMQPIEQEAARDAIRETQEFWLPVLEDALQRIEGDPDVGLGTQVYLRAQIARLRRALGVKVTMDKDKVRAQTRERVRRHRERVRLGGERR